MYINWYNRILLHKTINDIYRPVNPVPCHGRFESLKPLYVQDTGNNQSQLSPVVVERNDSISKVNSSNNFCSEVYEQGKIGQLVEAEK